MRSSNQIAASQMNGAKSRGPVTPEGKLISSANSLKHGLLAKAIVVEGESPDQLAALSARFHAEFRPRTESETHYLETMIMCRWRLHRVWELESASLNDEIGNLGEALSRRSPRSRAAYAFRYLADHSRCFDLMDRYETRYARAFMRAHQCLMVLKSQPLPDWHDHVELQTFTADTTPDADPQPALISDDTTDASCEANLQPAVTTDAVPDTDPPPAITTDPIPAATPAPQDPLSANDLTKFQILPNEPKPA